MNGQLPEDVEIRQILGQKIDSFFAFVSKKQELNTNIKNFVGSAAAPAGYKTQYNPAPYDFDFNLYLYVRNIEDGTQIIEHILSYFTPDYTIKLKLDI